MRKEVYIVKATKSKEIIHYYDDKGGRHNTEAQAIKADKHWSNVDKAYEGFTSTTVYIGDYTSITKYIIESNIDLINKHIPPFNLKSSSRKNPYPNKVTKGIWYLIKTLDRFDDYYGHDYNEELMSAEDFHQNYLKELL